MDPIAEPDRSINFMDMQDKAKKLLQKTDVARLPSLPHILLPFLRICHDETISYGKLAEILRKDPALYTRLLTVCSRNGCNQSGDDNLEQMLQRLGINTIKSVAITSAVQQFFSRNNYERTEFVKQHWQHSLLCASVAEAMAERCAYKYPQEAYTAGLLHDIGQLILEIAYPNKYTATFARLSEDEYFHDLESDEFGTTHHHVGYELLKKHGGNRFLADAVLYHHEPVEKMLDAHPLVKIINLANQLSSSDFKQEDQQVFDAAEQLLGLSKQALNDILAESTERIKRFASSFEIDLITDGIDGDTAKQISSREQFKQVQLAEQVKNIALLDGLHQHLSRIDDRAALIEAIRQHTGILFGVNSSLLFLYNADTDSVRAVDCEYERLAELEIPLLGGRSLVTDALLDRQALHSFDRISSELSVVDQQLTGLTGYPGLICLPMTMNNTAVGVLVLGIDESHQVTLWKQLPLLNRFATEIAHTLSVTGSSDETSRATQTDSATALESRIREMAHEVSNPLSIINNYLEILSFKLDSDNPAQNDINTIKSEINRVGSIIHRLTEPASTTGEITNVDINALITDLTHVFQTSLFAAHNIQIRLDLDDSIPLLPSDANALKQIYTNLVKNSVEALPTNGQLMVYTQNNVNVDGQEHIEISVADDGPGIEPEILSRLFSPVKTTKGEGHAGLGLTIVKNLVADLHGSISCRSSEKGTSFHILLPK